MTARKLAGIGHGVEARAAQSDRNLLVVRYHIARGESYCKGAQATAAAAAAVVHASAVR